MRRRVLESSFLLLSLLAFFSADLGLAFCHSYQTGNCILKECLVKMSATKGSCEEMIGRRRVLASFISSTIFLADKSLLAQTPQPNSKNELLGKNLGSKTTEELAGEKAAKEEIASQLPQTEPLPRPEGKQLWLIVALDDDSSPSVEGGPFGSPNGGSQKRLEAYAKHKEYQRRAATPGNPEFIKKIMAGPQLTDDGNFMLGSAFIVESTKEEADAFIRNDPFYTDGVWKSVSITRYKSVAGILPHKGF